MSKTLVDIFRSTSDLENFFDSVRELGGDFPLTADELLALGQVYFERYPEKFVQRNLDEVRLGYQITRFCLLEKALQGFPEEVKGFFRQVFEKPEAAYELLKTFHQSVDDETLQRYFIQLQSSLVEIKNTVDELPKGMVKERFLGGLSTLYNVVYLLKILLNRSV